MKKRKFTCRIFIFSSLCSCSKILLPYCPLANFAKSAATLMSVPAVVSHVRPKMGNQTFCRTENFVLLVVPELSSSCTTAPSSTSPPHNLTISLEPANARSNEEATDYCSKGVAGNCKGEGIPEWFHREPRDRRNTSSRRYVS